MVIAAKKVYYEAPRATTISNTYFSEQRNSAGHRNCYVECDTNNVLGRSRDMARRPAKLCRNFMDNRRKAE